MKTAVNPEAGTFRRNNFATEGHFDFGPNLGSLAITQLEEVPAIHDLERCSVVGEHGAWKGCRDQIPEGTARGDVRAWASGPVTGNIPGEGGTRPLERRFLAPRTGNRKPALPLRRRIPHRSLYDPDDHVPVPFP